MNPSTSFVQAKPLKAPRLWLPILFVLVTGGLLLAMLFAMLAYQVVFLDRVYPGVQVADIDVGGMTKTEVMAVVSTHTPPYLTRSVTVLAGDKSWTFTGRELGMQVDLESTTNQAYAIGRRGNFLADVLTQWRLLFEPRSVEPVLLYDNSPIGQILQQIAGEIYQAPQDADLVIHPDGRVESIPARRGRQLVVEATRPLLEAAVFSSEDRPVMPIVQEIIPGITDTEPAASQATWLLSAPLIFRYNQGSEPVEWRLEPQTLVEMIDVVKEVDAEGKTRFVMKIDRAAFAPYFEKFAAAINQAPQDARLAFNTETNQVQVLQESRTGRSLDVEALSQQVLALTEQPTHAIELPVQVITPKIPSDNIEGLGIKELVAESTSYFKGSSQSRVHNIALAAAKFNDVIVPPGELFSFNKHLGQVTKEEGFDESLIIQGNRTSVGLGGGVCQVSTTAFRTAFFGGFEIVERWAHGYRVGWYETNSGPGLDATIFSPNVDFKFRNDTDYYILIKTETDREAGTVTFRFYSTRTGREVIVSEPETKNPVEHGPPIYEDDPSLPRGTVKQVDWAANGLDVTVTRLVKEGDTVVHQDTIFSHYNPWQAVYKVGTGE